MLMDRGIEAIAFARNERRGAVNEMYLKMQAAAGVEQSNMCASSHNECLRWTSQREKRREKGSAWSAAFLT